MMVRLTGYRLGERPDGVINRYMVGHVAEWGEDDCGGEVTASREGYFRVSRSTDFFSGLNVMPFLVETVQLNYMKTSHR